MSQSGLVPCTKSKTSINQYLWYFEKRLPANLVMCIITSLCPVSCASSLAIPWFKVRMQHTPVIQHLGSQDKRTAVNSRPAWAKQ